MYDARWGSVTYELRRRRLGELLVQFPDLRGRRVEARVGDFAGLDQLERGLAELAVCLRQLALLLDVLDAFLRLRDRCLGCLLRLVEKTAHRLPLCVRRAR